MLGEVCEGAGMKGVFGVKVLGERFWGICEIRLTLDDCGLFFSEDFRCLGSETFSKRRMRCS